MNRDHLLRLLNIMNFSMFSCSHFLSNRKQGVMSKRSQESTSKEGSAVTKPRPMHLVSRNFLSVKKNPSARCECFEQSGESRELCFTWRQENWWCWSFEDQCIDLRMIFVDNDKSREVYRNTNFEELQNCSISRRDWYWSIRPKFWMYHR